MVTIIPSIMDEIIRYCKGDVRRINHALLVYSYASLIAAQTGVNKKEKLIIGIVALLHDIGIPEAERKFQSSSGKYQEREGPPVAREILEPFALDTETLERICFIIGNHHSYKTIDGIDFQILIEADLLVNIYEDSVSHDFIRNVREKIFQTEPGIRLLDEMYPAKAVRMQ
ncbi:MAG: HD domain-containing protein [Methanospirillaceae archaeon]|nr:HD domain-containing protein [Methanospirillaceae archaeon]